MTDQTELELQRGLGRVEGQLISLHEKLDQLVDTVARNEETADDRITDLEHWQTAVLSKAKTVAAIISMGVSVGAMALQYILGG